MWAPGAGSVRVRTDDDLALERDGECWFGRFTGDDYLLVVDGEAWPDPCSRWQPEAKVLRLRRGDATLAADFAATTARGFSRG